MIYKYNMNNLTLYTFLLVAGFLYSGYKQSLHLQDSANMISMQFNNKFGLSMSNTFAILTILLYIFIEVVGAGVLLYSSVSGEYSEHAHLAAQVLAAYTAFMVYLWYSAEIPHYHLSAHVGMVGGLLLLADKF